MLEELKQYNFFHDSHFQEILIKQTAFSNESFTSPIEDYYSIEIKIHHSNFLNSASLGSDFILKFENVKTLRIFSLPEKDWLIDEIDIGKNTEGWYYLKVTDKIELASEYFSMQLK